MSIHYTADKPVIPFSGRAPMSQVWRWAFACAIRAGESVAVAKVSACKVEADHYLMTGRNTFAV